MKNTLIGCSCFTTPTSWGCGGRALMRLSLKNPLPNKPELKGVNQDELEQRESIWYLKGSETHIQVKLLNCMKTGRRNIKETSRTASQMGYLWGGMKVARRRMK